jgi:hypothetical protein
MIVTLNGQALDITIENERSIGELLSGVEAWLEESDQSVSGFSVDGEAVPVSRIDEACARELNGVERLDLISSSWNVLYRQALARCARAIEESLAERIAARAERRRPALAGIVSAYLGSPAANFLSGAQGTLFRDVDAALNEEAADPVPALESVLAEVRERERELDSPRAELAGARASLASIADRLEALPLELQTGKDAQAAGTLRDFSLLSAKLIRLVPLLKDDGLDLKETVIGSVSFRTYFEELGSTLKELTAGYENGDAILVGDLAEYELAPRLRSLDDTLGELADA